jgi:putative ABC transport system permease protein
MASISLPSSRYNKAQSKIFYESLLGRLRSLPGVQFAELCNVIPFSGDGQGGPFVVEGREPTGGQPSKVAWLRSITPGYFSAMGMPLLTGRSFQSQDTENSLRVAIVDDTLARTNWPNQDPLGKRLRIGSGLWMTIVGVVPNVKNRKLNEEPMPYIYQPYTQWLRNETRLVVRTSNDPNSIVPAVRQQLAGLDPELPLTDVSTIEREMARSVATTRITNWLMTSFAGIALLLAVIGIYGVMSINVIGRTNEFGIRMALGAQRSNVLKIVLEQGLRLALLGVAFGVPAAIGLTKLIQGVLFGVSATDSRTFVGISALLVVVTLLASYLPARRATKVDPLVALRYE